MGDSDGLWLWGVDRWVPLEMAGILKTFFICVRGNQYDVAV
jgi:hypothetical protein